MKTPYRTQKEAEDLKVYNEYLRVMTVNPGSMATAVEAHLMKKFKIHSRSTVWQTIRRVEQRYSSDPCKS